MTFDPNALALFFVILTIVLLVFPQTRPFGVVLAIAVLAWWLLAGRT